MDYERLLALLHLLYAAPGDLDKWRAFLEALNAAFEGSGVAFVSHDPRGGKGGVALCAQVDPAAVREYDSHWATYDPWGASSRWEQLGPGSVATGDELIRPADLVRTAFYNDFGKRYGLEQCIATLIERGPTGLSFLAIDRSRSQPRYGDAEGALLRELLPHLQRALQVHRRIAAASSVAYGALETFECLGHSVFVLDRGGRVIHVNGVGEKLLKCNKGLHLDQCELRTARLSDTLQLRKLVTGAVDIACGLGTRGGGTLLVGMPAGGVLRFVVAPVTNRPDLLSPQHACAIVLVSDPDTQPLLDEHRLREKFRLTPAESRLAGAIFEGYSLQQAADKFSVKIGTIRTRVKTIFEKTGTHRQAELVKLLRRHQGVPAR